jgi:hypothetical protein
MLPKVAGAAVQGASEVSKAPKAEAFSKVMESAYAKTPQPAPSSPAQMGTRPPAVARTAQPLKVQAAQAKGPTPAQLAKRTEAKPPVEAKQEAKALLNEVAGAQSRLDQLLKLAESGRTFSPAELLAFQAHAYQASQELDLAGRVVDKATSGVKQTLNTQV